VMTKTQGPHIVFLVSEDWYFVSHRLRLGQAALARGYRVTLISRFAAHRDQIASVGIETIPLNIRRADTNPFADLGTLVRLVGIYRRLAPDIAYQVAVKPVLLGTLAARLAGVKRRVNALGGVGVLFGDTPSRLKPMRRMVALAFRLLLQRDQTIVQNDADLHLLQSRAAVPRDCLHLIAGAGVDLNRFYPRPELAEGPVTITLVSRMLWEKGVGELVAATELLSARDIPARVLLVGKPDPQNPRSIDETQLLEWNRRGLVRWLGHVGDINEVWAQSHIAVLPSYYREGVPKSLMEAAACGRPIVTTDLPGCRDATIPGITGLLVPPRDPEALADALGRLVRDDHMRRTMGEEARRDAETRFSDESINGRILDLCDQLVGPHRRELDPVG